MTRSHKPHSSKPPSRKLLLAAAVCAAAAGPLAPAAHARFGNQPSPRR